MKKIIEVENSSLKNEVDAFLEIYPKYVYDIRFGQPFSRLQGPVDVCDQEGNYLETYIIEIILEKKSYPYSCPIVRECSEKIERHENWHIDDNGLCCLNMEHELEYEAKAGIKLIKYYQNSIYPYFANVLHKKRFGRYANGEYLHEFDGVVQFYAEKFKLENPSLILKMLKATINNKIPGRNKPCICGLNNKFKRCHLENMRFLKRISKKRLLKDIRGFEEICGIPAKTKYDRAWKF